MSRAALHCPACHQPLEAYQYQTMLVDVCAICHGMWLDKGELGALVLYLGEELQPTASTSATQPPMAAKPAKEATLPCPRCRLPLQKFNYAYDSNIILDRCSNCGGVWTDRGELYKIILHTLHATKGNV